MKEQELRLGSYYHQEGFYRLERDKPRLDIPERDFVLNKETLVWILTEGELEFIKPIELTEEWLLKFGGCHVINNMFKLNNFIIKISEQGFYVVWMNERLFFRYVHDLQNWYYLTTKLIRGTGEELTIKETAK